MQASAPPVTHWLLIEQPGPWGEHPWRESGLPAEVVDALAAQASAAHARVLLIRRPGRTAPGPRRWAFVDSRPGTERVWWRSFDDPRELLDLGLDRPLGEPSTEPVYLVCAHGRHDTCCAVRGRPVAAALAARGPERAWECSHVGGDRFAANLVVLPHGFYFGQVTAQAANDLADDFEAGLLDLDRLRGRSTFTAPVQAAQHLTRVATGERRLDAYPPIEVAHVGHEHWRVDLRAPDGDRLSVGVRATFHRSDTPLTCKATVPAAIRTFVAD